MNKHLYVDSTGRVCRIDADTGAMIPVEWNQPDVDAARKRYELARAESANFDVSRNIVGKLNGLTEFAAFPADSGNTHSIGMVGDTLVRVTQDGLVQYWNGDVEVDKP